jgi:hypothetical protein
MKNRPAQHQVLSQRPKRQLLLHSDWDTHDLAIDAYTSLHLQQQHIRQRRNLALHAMLHDSTSAGHTRTNA